MKHFLVLFFDEAASSRIQRSARTLFAEYCPGAPFPAIEHHLTIQYFQCEERHYPEIVTAVAPVVAASLPLAITVDTIHEYINHENDFCCLSMLVGKSPALLELHRRVTAPLDALHLHHEPESDWPPHITCFPGIPLRQRRENFTFASNKCLLDELAHIRTVEMRLTRWTGTHIETIHRFQDRPD